jgi:hypothetical protein
MTRILSFAVFLVGLAVVGWIGAGYIGSNPLALGVTALIGVFYLIGARELQLYHKATATLSRAVASLSDAPVSLAGWLDRLHPTLRNPARLRIEGERAGLPGPSLTPYIVGLLVLLGMLGTFLGMIVTLRGTGTALQSATDLQAIRASLAAPIKGLGFAFGTSVAGVATSAMLGLLSALCRRERIESAQELDARIATTLRGYSRGHQREETFKLLQRQAEAMPVLVDRLQAMMTAMEQRNQTLGDQLAAGMASMERQSAALNEQLATGQESLNRQLSTGQASLNERLAASQDALNERLTADHATLSRRLSEGQETLAQRLSADQESLGQRLVAGQENLGARLAASQETAATRLAASQESFHDKAEAAYARLASSVDQSLKDSLTESARLAAAAFQPVVEATMASVAREAASLHETIARTTQQQHDTVTRAVQQQHDAVTHAVQHQLDGLSTRFETATATIAGIWNEALTGHQQASDTLVQDLRASLDRYADTFEQRSSSLLDGLSARLDTTTGHMSQAWAQALSRHEEISGKLVQGNQQALAESAATLTQHASSMLKKAEDHSATLLQNIGQHSSSLLQHFDQHSSSLLQSVRQSQADLQETLVSRDEQRLQTWTDSLGAIAADLRLQWQQTGEQTAMRQQEICETLARTAQDITSHTQAYASETIAEISRLMQAASEAPKAAAEVVAELRQKLSDSMVRDNAMLEERARLLETLGTLLDAVNRASTEQRDAVDALVTTSADLLGRVGSQFTDKLEAEAGRLEQAAGQVTSSVVEVASLGEAFGMAVRSFGESNDKLTAHLERIEAALEKSIARGDEQLAYYVAQAREVVDLSVMSQKQILEDLQQLAAGQASAGTEAA